MNEAERLKDFVGCEVVIDTDSPYIHVGKLVSVDDCFYELEVADVHDTTATTSTRDVYIINVQKYGVKKNRERVLIRTSRVVSISRTDEVTAY